MEEGHTILKVYVHRFGTFSQGNFRFQNGSNDNVHITIKAGLPAYGKPRIITKLREGLERWLNLTAHKN